MNVFISHNKIDKETARFLAIALVEQGANVWFDEWEIRPGDSITGGIEAGLSNADTFVLVWSKNASKSKWVGTEIRAYIRRRVDDESLRIVPIVLDGTSLPALVADYSGFFIDRKTSLNTIAFEITGRQSDIEIARRLHQRISELALKHCGPEDPLPYIICPSCGSEQLRRTSSTDEERDEIYFSIGCENCEWKDFG